ncbi:hypothetical protein PIB30_087668 [Stylosanthes scabra]|uniref:Uncharacterized protein n=1 Tax=Stylosanthes scabra TaxID=79078 RepID=A0ABU6TVU2_9FABA|nr:hypothetical protein [Stylosanthes scabra]
MRLISPPPPPPGYEEDDTDSELERLKKKTLRKKSPKKSPKKVVSPRQKKGINESGPSKGEKQSKKYTGARRRHVLRDSNRADDGLGVNSGPGPDLWKDLGGSSNANNVGASGKRTVTSDDINVPSVDPNAFEQESDY